MALEFTNDEVTTPLEKAQRELRKNRQIWESKGFTNYRMAFQWSCFCAGEFVSPVEISVRGGIIDGVVFSESGTPVEPPNFDRYETVAGLFELIQNAIDRDAFSISVEYDTELGYPARAGIDFDERLADEEMGFTAKVHMEGS